MSNRPHVSAKKLKGDFAEFTEFARRVMAVPYANVQAKLRAEKQQKAETKARSVSSGRVASGKG